MICQGEVERKQASLGSVRYLEGREIFVAIPSRYEDFFLVSWKSVTSSPGRAFQRKSFLPWAGLVGSFKVVRA